MLVVTVVALVYPSHQIGGAGGCARPSDFWDKWQDESSKLHRKTTHSAWYAKQHPSVF